MRGDGVLLLHGMGRTSSSMSRMAAHLAAAGYATLNLDYPSRTRGLAGLADHVQMRAHDWCDALPGRVHLVTHSMGGLVARVWVTRHRPERLGRIVMLAPPSAGSEIADLLSRSLIYRSVFGPAGLQLGTRRDAGTALLLDGELDCEVGIVAGTRALDPLGWMFLPKPNDGKVSVARTWLAGMADHLVLPVTHTFIAHHPAAIDATTIFLRDGGFTPASGRSRGAGMTGASRSRSTDI